MKGRDLTVPKPMHHNESPDLETQTHPTPVGPNTNEPGTSSIATTTKHPRHRPGCSCIVCIQPPSGKGKHKPTCICNVCMTVKRRFKTLMMRKKKRQSEREAELAQRNQNQLPLGAKEEAEVDSVPKRSEGEIVFRGHSEDQLQEYADLAKGGGLDLNCCPGREQMEPSRVSMMSLVQEASLPLDMYLKQNGLTSLICEQQGASVNQENTAQTQDDRGFSAVVQEHEGSIELSEKDQRENEQSHYLASN